MTDDVQSADVLPWLAALERIEVGDEDAAVAVLSGVPAQELVRLGLVAGHLLLTLLAEAQGVPVGECVEMVRRGLVGVLAER